MEVRPRPQPKRDDHHLRPGQPPVLPRHGPVGASGVRAGPAHGPRGRRRHRQLADDSRRHIRCLGERTCVMNTNLPAIPGWVLVVLGVLAVVQITLDVIALVDLYRRPVKQVVLGNKWIWVVIVLLVNTLGAIVYLVAGRKPAAIAENARTASPPARIQNIADTLYGPRDDTDPR